MKLSVAAVLMSLVVLLFGHKQIEVATASFLKSDSATANANDRATANDHRPIYILVHGTHYDGLDVTMNRLAQFFLNDGVSADHVFTPTYDSRKDWEGIRADLGPKISQIVRDGVLKNPHQRFVILGHSLGEFAALYTLVKTVDPFYVADRDPPAARFISSRFELLIGLAGIARGLDRLNPFPENQLLNVIAIRLALKTVVSAADDQLTPYFDDNALLREFYEASDAEISRTGFRKCALFTPNDRLVREPLEAGKLSEEWYEVPESILPLIPLEDSSLDHIKSRALEAMTETHLEFIKNLAVYRFMTEKCKLPLPSPLPIQGAD